MMDAGGGSRYELLELIGAGGMAEVFRARMVGAVGFEKQVAIKRILPDFSSDQEFIQRFIDEARLTARLVHPNICQILDFGTMEDRYFIAMEYVEGLDLAGVLAGVDREGERFPVDVALFVLCGVLRGLKHAHEAKDEGGQPLGIVHRDISPSNVLLSINGDVKVGDLGAATANPEVRSARTERHFRLGKVLYMAPEQRRMQAVDARADLYSVGILLAETLLGETKFHKNANMFLAGLTTLWGQVEEDLSSPLGAELSRVIERALQEDPRRRYQTADEMLSELDRVMVEYAPGTSVDRVSRLVARIKRRFEEVRQSGQSLAKPQVSAAISLNTGDFEGFTGSDEASMPGIPDFELDAPFPEPLSARPMDLQGLDDSPTMARGTVPPSGFAHASPPPGRQVDDSPTLARVPQISQDDVDGQGLDEYTPTLPSGQIYAEGSLELLDQPLDDDYDDEPSQPSHQTPIPAEGSGWAGAYVHEGGTAVEPEPSRISVAPIARSRWPRWLPGLVIGVLLIAVLVFGLVFGGVLADRYLAGTPTPPPEGPDPTNLVGTTPGAELPSTQRTDEIEPPPQTPPSTGSDAAVASGEPDANGEPDASGEPDATPTTIGSDAAQVADTAGSKVPRERPDRPDEHGQRGSKGHRSPERRGATGRTGYLNVLTRPFGVPFVDGRQIAPETPVSSHELPVGRHVVKVYFPQHGRSVRRPVLIQSGKVTPVVINLNE